MTYNELVQRIAKRAGELARKTKTDLILTHPDNTEGTKSGAQWNNVSRGSLVSDILYDEFDLEYDYELSDARD